MKRQRDVLTSLSLHPEVRSHAEDLLRQGNFPSTIDISKSVNEILEEHPGLIEDAKNQTGRPSSPFARESFGIVGIIQALMRVNRLRGSWRGDGALLSFTTHEEIASLAGSSSGLARSK